MLKKTPPPKEVRDFISFLKTPNSEFVVLINTNDTCLYSVADGKKLDMRTLKILFGKHCKSFSFYDYEHYILASLETVVGFTYRPDKGGLVPLKSGDLYEKNTYRSYSPSTEYAPDFDMTLWFEYLERLFPNQEERHTACQFLSHMFQKPPERPTWGLMLTSDTGTGKGVLFNEILNPLLAGTANQASSYSDLTGKHSTILLETLLVMLDDPKCMTESTMTQIKSKLSEPCLKVERKYQQESMERTYARILLASNELRPLRLDESERRWFSPEYINHKVSREETQLFITSLLEMVSNGGLDQIYYWFLSYDLTGFNPNYIHQTDTLKAMIAASVPVEVDQLLDWVSHTPVFSWQTLMSDFTGINSNLLRSYLQKIGYIKKRLTNNKVKYSVWHPKAMDIGEVKERFLSFDF